MACRRRPLAEQVADRVLDTLARSILTFPAQEG
jgi:hypothetical protein